jgi:hypothetical protein
MAAEHFYVQVRSPAEHRWVAVAESADRLAAETFAQSASPTASGPRGRWPEGLRVVSSQDLVFEGGTDAVTRAIADVRPQAATP